MTSRVKLPNIECPDEEHPAGNRFMEHVGTRRPAETTEPDDKIDSIAMFQCVKCKRVTTQPFDPDAPTKRRRVAPQRNRETR